MSFFLLPFDWNPVLFLDVNELLQTLIFKSNSLFSSKFCWLVKYFTQRTKYIILLNNLTTNLPAHFFPSPALLTLGRAKFQMRFSARPKLNEPAKTMTIHSWYFSFLKETITPKENIFFTHSTNLEELQFCRIILQDWSPMLVSQRWYYFSF